jgi:hypothetical protein
MVKGASTVNWTSMMGGPRSDFAFPRALEAELLGAGRPADVQVISRPSELASKTLLDWEREFLGFSPDVVILVYGHFETIHLFLPRWLERHANSLRTRSRPLTNAYRRFLLKPTWKTLARIQAFADRRLPPTIRKSRPRRVAEDIGRLITQLQKLQSPLVLVFELIPPASRGRKWFPGMTARMAVMNQALEGMVARFDRPNVRFFRTSRLVEKYAGGDLDVATPDGFHFSPYLHAMIGRALAEEILDWAHTQPHLAGSATAGLASMHVELVQQDAEPTQVDLDVAHDRALSSDAS